MGIDVVSISKTHIHSLHTANKYILHIRVIGCYVYQEAW
jgi:hypothetical protein